MPLSQPDTVTRAGEAAHQDVLLGWRRGQSSLAERLGYAPDARLLIVNCDDLGSSRAANVAIYEALRDGLATKRDAHGAVPVGARRRGDVPRRRRRRAPHAQRRVEQLPLGSDHALAEPARRRRRVPRTVEDVWDHADLDEVRKECRAQVERAIYWGFDVATSTATWARCSCARPSSTCTSRWRSTSGSRCAWPRARPSA